MNYLDEWNELVAPANHNFKCKAEVNYRVGRGDARITHIVVHITGGDDTTDRSFDAAKNEFVGDKKKSIHYMIKGDGTITQFVKDKDTAWHAGIADSKTTGAGSVIGRTTIPAGYSRPIERELYFLDSNEWKHWRCEPQSMKYEYISAFAESRPLYKWDWDAVYPGRNKPFGFNKDHYQDPNQYSIGIELVGPTFYTQEDFSVRKPQIDGLIKLLKNLIEKYDIPIDREHLVGHEDVNPISRFHWDPGPGFDWADIIDRVKTQLCFPLEPLEKSAPSTQWYANTELRGKGGYYPIGSNHTIHTGVHLFSNSPEQPVRAMAPGYVAAFRFFNRMQHRTEAKKLESLKLTHTNTTSFVLVRHDLKLGGDGEAHPLYSLYMDLENLRNGEDIPWITRLREMTRGTRIAAGSYETLGSRAGSEGAGVFTRPPLEKLGKVHAGDITNIYVDDARQAGKVITVSEPVLPVEAGEIIGYTQGDPKGEGNYAHWEVFTTEAGLFKKLAGMYGDGKVRLTEITPQAGDGVFTAGEINELFGANLWSSIYNTLVDREGASFEKFIAAHYASKERKYTYTLKTTVPPGVKFHKDVTVDVEGEDIQGNRLVGRLSGNTITFPREQSGRDNPLRISLKSLIGREHRIESDMGLKRIQITFPPGVRGSAAYGRRKELFEELGNKEKVLRNVIYTMKSPWTAGYWRETVDGLKDKGYVDKNYVFNKDDFLEYILFDGDYEYALFDSIVRGDGYIKPDEGLHYMHPATFLWMLSLLNLNDRGETVYFNTGFKYKRANPVQWAGFKRAKGEKEPLRPGEEIKILAIGESFLPGVVELGAEQIPQTGASFNMNSFGIGVYSIAFDYWGTYDIAGLGGPVGGLAQRLVVEKPAIQKSVLNAAAHTVVLEFDRPGVSNIRPLMRFRYAISDRASKGPEPEMKEFDTYVALSPDGEGKDVWRYDLEPLFEAIMQKDHAMSYSESLALEYQVILYDASHKTVFPAADHTVEKSSVPSGTDFVIFNGGYQDISLNYVYPQFDNEPLDIHAEKPESGNAYRIGTGLTFTNDSASFDATDFKVEASVKYEGEGESVSLSTKQGGDASVTREGNTLLCMIKADPSLFLKQGELTICFITRKGPRRRFEASGKLVNPVKEAKLTYDKNKKEVACTMTIDAAEKLFPGWYDVCQIKLNWRNLRHSINRVRIPWEKWLVNGEERRQVKVEKSSGDIWNLRFTIPFTEIRGDSLSIDLYDSSGTVFIAGIPETAIEGEGFSEEKAFKGPWLIKEYRDYPSVKMRLRPGEAAEYNGQFVKNGDAVWVLHNESGGAIIERGPNGKGIMESYYKVEGYTKTDKTLITCYIFQSRVVYE